MNILVAAHPLTNLGLRLSFLKVIHPSYLIIPCFTIPFCLSMQFIFVDLSIFEVSSHVLSYPFQFCFTMVLNLCCMPFH